jgi:hypothetical protein
MLIEAECEAGADNEKHSKDRIYIKREKARETPER